MASCDEDLCVTVAVERHIQVKIARTHWKKSIAEGVVCASLWLVRTPSEVFYSSPRRPPLISLCAIMACVPATPATPASSVRAFRASLRRGRGGGRAYRTPTRSAPAPRSAFADNTGDDDASLADGSASADLLRRLHVNFLALRRGSRFAAQEFSIVATEAYERGVTMPSLRMDISLLGLSTASDLGLSEQDAFLSHLGMCMMTLWEMGWPSRGGEVMKSTDRRDTEGDKTTSAQTETTDTHTKAWSPVGIGNPENDKEARGLLAYIRATHQRSDAGYTLKRMEMERLMTLTQRAKGGDGAWDHPEGWQVTQRLDRDSLDPEAGGGGNEEDNIPVSQKGIASAGGATHGPLALGETDAVKLMRVNCRLTLLLREFVFASRGLRTVAEVISTRDEELDAMDLRENKQVRGAGTDDTDDTDEETDDTDDSEETDVSIIPPQVALEWSSAPRDLTRVLAARLLVAYVSCLTSHPAGLRSFVSAALDARAAGIPASALAKKLNPAEFDVEGSRRGMFGASADAGKFFALFLTSAYVAADEDELELQDTVAFRDKKKAATAKKQETEKARFSQKESDPDVFAWAPAPGEESFDVGWAAVVAGTMTEDEADKEEELRRRSVSGMRASVRAWMHMVSISQ
jgi:hypothetical protein